MGTEVKHPILDEKERRAWIEGQLAEGRSQREIFDSVKSQYAMPDELASSVGLFLDPEIKKAIRPLVIAAAVAFVVLAVAVFVLRIGGQSFSGNIGAVIGGVIDTFLMGPMIMLVGAVFVSQMTTAGVAYARFFAWLGALYPLIASLQMAVHGPKPLNIALLVVCLAASVLLVLLTRRIRDMAIPHYSFWGRPQKDENGDYNF